ncbi:hypothetical protein BLNAU_661 [Blattamonas nauphoetae]|uniref:CUE domain-containing protein n=1 Tax=Blattamonas nauphoetae TaxID=2049346 RepID=A0ABQ9YKE8_9EUKA|nr:hypothetical protein BLNAU_661 [Blattamonas nauphoetae]
MTNKIFQRVPSLHTELQASFNFLVSQINECAVSLKNVVETGVTNFTSQPQSSTNSFSSLYDLFFFLSDLSQTLPTILFVKGQSTDPYYPTTQPSSLLPIFFNTSGLPALLACCSSLLHLPSLVTHPVTAATLSTPLSALFYLSFSLFEIGFVRPLQEGATASSSFARALSEQAVENELGLLVEMADHQKLSAWLVATLVGVRTSDYTIPLVNPEDAEKSTDSKRSNDERLFWMKEKERAELLSGTHFEKIGEEIRKSFLHPAFSTGDECRSVLAGLEQSLDERLVVESITFLEEKEQRVAAFAEEMARKEREQEAEKAQSNKAPKRTERAPKENKDKLSFAERQCVWTLEETFGKQFNHTLLAEAARACGGDVNQATMYVIDHNTRAEEKAEEKKEEAESESDGIVLSPPPQLELPEEGEIGEDEWMDILFPLNYTSRPDGRIQSVLDWIQSDDDAQMECDVDSDNAFRLVPSYTAFGQHLLPSNLKQSTRSLLEEDEDEMENAGESVEADVNIAETPLEDDAYVHRPSFETLSAMPTPHTRKQRSPPPFKQPSQQAQSRSPPATTSPSPSLPNASSDRYTWNGNSGKQQPTRPSQDVREEGKKPFAIFRRSDFERSSPSESSPQPPRQREGDGGQASNGHPRGSHPPERGKGGGQGRGRGERGRGQSNRRDQSQQNIFSFTPKS